MIKVDGTINKTKVKLTAQGFTKNEGLDLFDTYELVVKTVTLQILTSLVSIYELEIHQMNVKMTFLNGELNEEKYI